MSFKYEVGDVVIGVVYYDSKIERIIIGKIMGFYSVGYELRVLEYKEYKSKSRCFRIGKKGGLHRHWIEKSPQDFIDEIRNFLDSLSKNYKLKNINIRLLKEKVIFT